MARMTSKVMRHDQEMMSSMMSSICGKLKAMTEQSDDVRRTTRSDDETSVMNDATRYSSTMCMTVYSLTNNASKYETEREP